MWLLAVERVVQEVGSQRKLHLKTYLNQLKFNLKTYLLVACGMVSGYCLIYSGKNVENSSFAECERCQNMAFYAELSN